ncbi:hypothetical protein [Kitasatospora sp. NPDC088134]|uniref:hypothetical protein n=1 Tax=Kitasatospora sp. NPDC088134 TaxID=3364071 RepID=UPI00380F1E70
MSDGLAGQQAPYVAALGELTVHSEAGGTTRLSEGPAALLLRLVFAQGAPLHGEHLLTVMPRGGSINALSQTAKIVRDALSPHGVVLPNKLNGAYSLPKGQLRLDALEFPGLVARLGQDPSVEDLVPLLAIWRGDPEIVHCGIDRRHWQKALDARSKVVEAAGRLFEQGHDVEGWLAFVERFPTDPAVRTADTLHPGRVPSARPRLLIVEDHPGMAESLVKWLRHYDTTVAHSMSEYFQLLADRPPLFDGALVDRHLTESNDDQDGYEVLLDLKERGIPRILLTAYFPGGNVEARRKALTERFGLSGICIKGGGEDFDLDLRHTVRQMLGRG